MVSRNFVAMAVGIGFGRRRRAVLRGDDGGCPVEFIWLSFGLTLHSMLRDTCDVDYLTFPSTVGWDEAAFAPKAHSTNLVSSMTSCRGHLRPS